MVKDSMAVCCTYTVHSKYRKFVELLRVKIIIPLNFIDSLKIDEKLKVHPPMLCLSVCFFTQGIAVIFEDIDHRVIFRNFISGGVVTFQLIKLIFSSVKSCSLIEF